MSISPAEKIMHHLFPNLKLKEYGMPNSDTASEVLKEEFEKAKSGRPFLLD